jgi:hypothetical protein
MNKILFSLLALCVSINGFSQKFSSTIKSLPNEKWYGHITIFYFNEIILL